MASQPGHGAFDRGSGGAGSPWTGGSSDNELSRQAGVDDIGRTHSSAAEDTRGGSGHGLFDDRNDDEARAEHVSDDLDDGTFDSDFDC
jgi:hypothetical protein